MIYPFIFRPRIELRDKNVLIGASETGTIMSAKLPNCPKTEKCLQCPLISEKRA